MPGFPVSVAGLAAVTSAAVSVLLAASAAWATPVTLGRTEVQTDYVSAGLGGLGSGGGTINVTGVTGTVRKAFLYWHGIDNSASNAVYDNQTISFAGAGVTGVSLGDAETNCWGAGSSRAFFADVTGRVSGNGSYEISGLNATTGHNGNGASLIVLFNDASSANDRDLVFFEGNDSDSIQIGFPPGDAVGWAATLSGINYTGGSVFAQLHVADGQSAGDGTLTFTSTGTPVTIFDTGQLWDGNSVPNAGFSRAGLDGLWDIHKFDITATMGSPGSKTIDVSGMFATGDCHGLIVLMLDLAAGSAPCGNGVLDEGEECDPAGSGDADCEGSQTCLNDCSCGCSNDFQCNDGSSCTTDSCNVETGACEHASACPSTPECQDTCDEIAGECRLCGRPFGNDVCVANAVFVLQCALGLRDCELCTCDVDASGSVTTTDSLIILRGCAGLPADLQCSAAAAAAGLFPGGSSTLDQEIP